jgi:hypothetical protein
MPIGSTFQTNEIVKESGVYQNMTHDHPADLFKEIPLSKDEKFPPCKGCQTAVTWKLLRRA